MRIFDEADARDYARQLALEAVPVDRSVTSPAVAEARAQFEAQVEPALHGLFDEEAEKVFRHLRRSVMLFGLIPPVPKPKPRLPTPPPSALATRLVLRLVVAHRELLRSCASVSEMLEQADGPIRAARAEFLAAHPFSDPGPFDDSLVRTLGDLS